MSGMDLVKSFSIHCSWGHLDQMKQSSGQVEREGRQRLCPALLSLIWTMGKFPVADDTVMNLMMALLWKNLPVHTGM